MGFFKGQSGGGTWSVIKMGLPAEDVPSIEPETYSILVIVPLMGAGSGDGGRGLFASSDMKAKRPPQN
jgi:hypothetical protein